MDVVEALGDCSRRRGFTFEGSMEACSRVCVNMLIAFALVGQIPATWGSVGDKRFHAADVYGEPEPVRVALTHGMLLLL